MDSLELYIYVATVGGQSLIEVANTLVTNENFKREVLLQDLLGKPEICSTLNKLLATKNMDLPTIAKVYLSFNKIEITDKTLVSTLMLILIYKDYLKEAK